MYYSATDDSLGT